MSYDLVGWLAGVIVALVAFIAIKSRNDMSGKIKEQERRINDINNSKVIRDEVENMGDDALLHSASQWLRNKDRK